MTSPDELLHVATQLKTRLQAADKRLVLAESCTGGLIAATLAGVPGISAVLAGSLVVYQVDSKRCWLQLDPNLLEIHDVVSQPVSQAMAEGAIRQTPHANLALAVTGHLGPQAPTELDGTAWCAICLREGEQLQTQARQLTLDTSSAPEDPTKKRVARQHNAVRLGLNWLTEILPVNATTNDK